VGNDALFEIVQNQIQVVSVEQTVGRVCHIMSSLATKRVMWHKSDALNDTFMYQAQLFFWFSGKSGSVLFP
jgi:hypothetical protein